MHDDPRDAAGLRSATLELHEESPNVSDDELGRRAFDIAVATTTSAIGFFHLVSADQTSVILTAWNEGALAGCSAATPGHYPIVDAGNWVDCVRLRRPVIHNDYPTSPNRRGLPDGHFPVTRMLSLPVVASGRIRCIFGVRNKADPYDERDIGCVATFVDVTASRQHRAALTRAMQDAEAAARAKSEFLAVMSHEIRTPMNGVIGAADLLFETDLTLEQRGLLTTLRDSSDTLLAIINDILDLSKIDAQRLELEAIEFGIRDLVDRTCRAQAFAAHRAALELLWEVEGDVPSMLIGDPARLRQILTNLVSNAITFTHEGDVVVRVAVMAARPGSGQSAQPIGPTGLPPPAGRMLA